MMVEKTREQDYPMQTCSCRCFFIVTLTISRGSIEQKSPCATVINLQSGNIKEQIGRGSNWDKTTYLVILLYLKTPVL